MDCEYDVLGGYMPSFVEHLKDTRARLGLGSEDYGAVEDVSHAGALSTWTSTEHNAFFRALSVHSRWRPDLIAACIPTRTEWEVWMYLEALEEGVAALTTQQGSHDVGMEGSSDGRPDVDASASHSEPDTDEDEGGCEPALEVSQAWIDVEEHMASWIVRQEHLASVEADVADTNDVDGESRKRKRGRSRGTGRGRAQSRGQTVSREGRYSDHYSPSPGSPSTSGRHLSVSSTRRREALMGCLESSHLLVLDGILREDEEATREKGKSREGSVTGTLTEHGDQDERQARWVNPQRLFDRTSTTQGTSNVSGAPSNVVIDPVLLALSGGADPIGPQAPSENTSKEYTSRSCEPARIPNQSPSLLPNAASQQTSLEVSSQPRRDDTAHANPDPLENVDPSLSILSPRSRRRIQKRLYMRRKRATLREESAVDTGIQKLRPGKKAKMRHTETPAISQSVPGSEAPSNDERELAEDAPRKNKGGLTLPYKLKAQFSESGIDAAYLRSQGMDVLNLGALGKLMGLTSSLELGEEEMEIAEFIDGQLIRHLQAAMVSFVTDIIHRAIVWREREIRLKQRCRAWRQGDQITIGAIEHAVEAVGARYHSHKEYLKALEVFHGLSTELSNPPRNEAEEPSPADRGVEATDLPAVLSPHREGYTPLIRPPATWSMGALACLSERYEREATRTRRGPSADLEEEEMSSETDSEALLGELEEEAERETWEMEEGEREERGLWESVKR